MADMSMADVLALQGRNDGMGGSSWLWWVLLIFLLAGGSGFGFCGANAAAQGITNEFLFSNLSQGINANATRINTIGDGISSLGYSMANQMSQNRYDNMVGQNGIQQSINTLGMNMQQCCCQLGNTVNTGFSNLQNQMQMNTMNIMQNECNNTQKIIDLINTNTTQALRDKLAEYQVQASNAAQSAYLISQLKAS